MALPNCGWLFHCELCEIITSRITKILRRRKSSTYSVCLACRSEFLKRAFDEYGDVHIENETVGEQTVRAIK